MDPNTVIVDLIPTEHWHWHTGGPIERNWNASVTLYGPVGSHYKTLGRNQVAFMQWVRLPIEPHRGQSSGGLASLAGKGAVEEEEATDDEVSGPIAQILPIPANHDGDDDELDGITEGLANAQGKAVVLETTAGGWNDRTGAPHPDWMASRFGPNPPEGMVEYELPARTDQTVQLRLNQYAADLQDRTAAFQKLVAGGMDIERATAVSGVLMADD